MTVGRLGEVKGSIEGETVACKVIVGELAERWRGFGGRWWRGELWSDVTGRTG